MEGREVERGERQRERERERKGREVERGGECKKGIDRRRESETSAVLKVIQSHRRIRMEKITML